MHRRPFGHGAAMAKRLITPTFAALALAGLLSACSGGGSGNGAASASSDQDLSAVEEAEFETESEFAKCMRDHGIKGFPDPQVNDDGIMIVGVPWRGDAEHWNAPSGPASPSSTRPPRR